MYGFKRICCVIAAAVMACYGLGADARQVNSVGYAVSVILPDNQLDDKAAYFDLKVKPGQSQVLKVAILNREDKEIEVAVEANTAFTNENGVIEFAPNDDEPDSSLAVDFGEIVTPIDPEATISPSPEPSPEPTAAPADMQAVAPDDETAADTVVLKVPPNGETIAEFLLEVPEEPFEGMVLGGLAFMMLGQGKELGEGGMGVSSVYRYVIGVRLQEDETPSEPAFELNGVELKPGDAPALLLKLRNPQPLIARNITINVSLYQGDSKEAAISLERTGVSMAPNSAMAYRIRLKEDERPEAGIYRAAVELKFQDASWQYETEITVP